MLVNPYTTSLIKRMNVEGLRHNPKGITLKQKLPNGVVIVVLSLFSEIIDTWLYAFCKSIFENIFERLKLLTKSNRWGILKVGRIVMLFSFL